MTTYNDEIPRIPTHPNHTTPGIPVRRDRHNQLMMLTPHGHGVLQQHALPPSAPIYQADPRAYTHIYHPDVAAANGSSFARFTYPFNVPVPNHYPQPPNVGVQASNRSVPTEPGPLPVPVPGPAVHESDNFSPDRIYLCEWRACNRSFSQLEDRKQHFHTVYAHSPPDRKPCEWGNCCREFARSRDLNRHVDKEHLSPKPPPKSYACPGEGCDKTFGRKDNVDRHVRKFHNQSP